MYFSFLYFKSLVDSQLSTTLAKKKKMLNTFTSGTCYCTTLMLATNKGLVVED